MDENKPLPIQIVLPRKEDIKKTLPGGNKTYMGECTPELRRQFAAQFQELFNYYEDKFKEYPSVPCVGKVIMKDKAIAKSHKPVRLFSEDNCPIIGTGKLNELYIKMTPSRIHHTIDEILHSETEDLKINLTKVEKVIPYTVDDIIVNTNLKNHNAKIGEPLKIKLFDYQNEIDNRNNINEFLSLIKKLGLTDSLSELKYSPKMKIYKLTCDDPNCISKISRFNGVKQIDFFPRYFSFIEEIKEVEKQLPNLPAPEPGREYPIIGIVDSGIKPGHKYLEPWIYKREVFVHEEYRNYSHGTFVAGVLEYGHILNNLGNRETMFKILDVVAIPNGNPKYGKTDSISEDELLTILETVLQKYSQEVKIWNLSLGTNTICDENYMSDLAVALDELQDEFKVDIFLSAGNYQTPPLRSWPPQGKLKDRITIPAESVRSITVGSIAHKKGCGCVEVNQPSPFSRCGPGPNFMVKPDVVDYGGNCSSDGIFTGCGIISFDEHGNLIENIGTSFSTPRVAGIYGEICSSLQRGYSSELAKALLIHNSKNPLNDKPISRQHANYFGFGIPSANLEEIIFCNKSKVTLVFNAQIQSGNFISIENFPYPSSLKKNNKWFGEIKMTLLYRPPLDANYGQEYCRSNIDVSLGTRFYDKNNILRYKGQVPPEEKWDEWYEIERVENGFKWSPIKTYYRNIKKGIEGESWRLRIECLSRSGETVPLHSFVLIVTIKDPNGSDIYSDTIRLLRERGFEYNSLQVQERVRNIYQI